MCEDLLFDHGRWSMEDEAWKIRPVDYSGLFVLVTLMLLMFMLLCVTHW